MNAPAGPLLEVRDLAIDLERADGDVRLVEDVSFTLDRGRTLGIVGETGSGKSLTAASLMRLLPPRLRIAEGDVTFEGRDLATLSDAALRRVRGNEIGMVFQDAQSSLNPAYTVGNQMVETIRTHTGMSKSAAFKSAVGLLDRVGIHRAGQRINDFPHQLSGGMAQRVMIALAISCDPKLLIADEPTTALDVTVQAQILTLLAELQAETGMSLLIISHDLSVIAEMADDVAVMYAGQLVEHGDVTSTFTGPTHPYTEALLGAQPESAVKGQPMATIPGIVPNADEMPDGCRFRLRCAYATDACATTAPALEPVLGREGSVARCIHRETLELIGLDGRAPEEDHATQPAEPDDRPVLLEVRDLAKTFKSRGRLFGAAPVFHAVDGVEFELREGETLGLVGESGAGKSTVGRMVLGLTPPSAGVVRFGGVDRASQRGATRRASRRDIQVVFQNPYASLDPMMTIGASIAEPLEVHSHGSRDERTSRVTELLTQVGLDPVLSDRRPHELSGGQRQRVAIARGLALNPKLIVCDEPVSALDVSTQAQVINLLRDLQSRFGIAYLFVGHDLSVVYQISDRIAVMQDGKIVEIGPAEQIYFRPQHDYTKALLASVLSADPRKRRIRNDVASSLVAE